MNNDTVLPGNGRATRTSALRLGMFTSSCLPALSLPGSALAGTFAVMSYNVRGLPPQVIENRASEIAAIAPLLEDFHTAAAPYVGMKSVVGLQELFFQSYYDVLTNSSTVTFPFITAKDTGGPNGIGDGLNILSDFKNASFTRVGWTDCFGAFGANGSDCDTNKGFSYSKVTVDLNVTIDVYTLHADAGQDTGSRTARRANINQLVTYMKTHSPVGTAVIVLGDTNSHYTRVGNDNIQNILTETGVTDVWVQLRRGGTVPTVGSDIDSDCNFVDPEDPSSGNCELVDKIFYRSGTDVTLVPTSYEALDDMFRTDVLGDLSDHYPVAVTFDYTPADRPCGDPILLGARPSDSSDSALDRKVAITDALYVLRASLKLVPCALCTCDVNNDTKINVVDALRVLKKAVTLPVTLICPACGGGNAS